MSISSFPSNLIIPQKGKPTFCGKCRSIGSFNSKFQHFCVISQEWGIILKDDDYSNRKGIDVLSQILIFNPVVWIKSSLFEFCWRHQCLIRDPEIFTWDTGGGGIMKGPNIFTVGACGRMFLDIYTRQHPGLQLHRRSSLQNSLWINPTL